MITRHTQLTDRQQEVLDYLRAEHRHSGIVPSTREIQAHFKFASQTAAMSHLRALERKGAIVRLPGKARAVMFPEEMDRQEIIDIPIYGSIAAGMAQLTEQSNEEGKVSIDVVSMGIPPHVDSFALKVRGSSMIDAHICDGDTVILERKDAREGDIVAALIDNEMTLKRFVRKNGRSYLQAENPDYPDLTPALELLIQGVMVGLIRTVK